MVALSTKAGANGLSARQAELQRFLHDPGCTCLLLLMSNSSGAAGLNLTVATTAFILDPAPNPGLEAQAAARIYRLGQTKPTRLVSATETQRLLYVIDIASHPAELNLMLVASTLTLLCAPSSCWPPAVARVIYTT
jgi:hypothetical protein